MHDTDNSWQSEQDSLISQQVDEWESHLQRIYPVDRNVQAESLIAARRIDDIEERKAVYARVTEVVKECVEKIREIATISE